jgi:hypothetical protein
VNDAFWPLSTVALLIEHDSAGFTVTTVEELDDAAGVPCDESVATSVYVVVDVGLTDSVLPVPTVVLPCFHVNEYGDVPLVPQPAVSVAL